MLDKMKLPFKFDAEQLKKDLSAIEPDQWIMHFNKSDYEGDWSVIPLRGPKEAIHPIQQIYSNPGVKEFEDTAFMDLCPHIKEAVYTLKCPMTSVRLMSLHAGSIIKEHVDHALGYDDGEVRIHIPVQTNDRLIFKFMGERVIMNEGETWYLNFSKPHSIKNNGQENRIHIVIDCIVDDWLRELFESESAKQEIN